MPSAVVSIVDRGALLRQFRRVRRASIEMCRPLRPEDFRVQPSEAASPSSPAGPSQAASTGGDGSSWPTSVPGWQLTYSTDFPGSSLPSGWLGYDGEPGGDPDGNWDSGNVTVSGGALNLLATPSAQAGVLAMPE